MQLVKSNLYRICCWLSSIQCSFRRRNSMLPESNQSFWGECWTTGRRYHWTQTYGLWYRKDMSLLLVVELVNENVTQVCAALHLPLWNENGEECLLYHVSLSFVSTCIRTGRENTARKFDASKVMKCYRFWHRCRHRDHCGADLLLNQSNPGKGRTGWNPQTLGVRWSSSEIRTRYMMEGSNIYYCIVRGLVGWRWLWLCVRMRAFAKWRTYASACWNRKLYSISSPLDRCTLARCSINRFSFVIKNIPSQLWTLVYL